MGAFNGKAFGLEVVALVKEHLAKAVAPLTERLSGVERRLDTLPTAKDGRGVAGALIDRDGNLILTLSDGSTCELGRVVGKDAEPAPSAPTDDVDDRLRTLERRLDETRPGTKGGVGMAGAVIDRDGHLVLTLSDGTSQDLGLVVGKDAEPARDGADGLGFEDMEEELADDGRTIVRRYRRGDLVKEFRHSVAVVLDRGVYKAGQEYEPGDAVTFGGSLWIAQAKTSERPEGGDAWRLAVKKGRDGKDIAR